MLSERIPLTKVKTMRKTLSGKKHAEQFPEGTCLQSVPDFFSWLKSIYPLRNIRDVFWEDGAPQRPLVL